MSRSMVTAQESLSRALTASTLALVLLAFGAVVTVGLLVALMRTAQLDQTFARRIRARALA